MVSRYIILGTNEPSCVNHIVLVNCLQVTALQVTIELVRSSTINMLLEFVSGAWRAGGQCPGAPYTIGLLPVVC